MCFRGLHVLTLALREEVSENDNLLPLGKAAIYLVNEEFFEDQTYETLSSRGKTVLMTFGPNFKVKQAQRHYRCLTEVLPSILLRNMAKSLNGISAPGSVRKLSSGDLQTSSYRNLRILIAEDNIVNQKVLSRILSRLGLENFVLVENGEKAVSRESAEPFDVVLMDMQVCVMPQSLQPRIPSACIS